MTRSYSMAYLTGNGLPPLKAIALAAKVGFDEISFRLLPAGPGDVPPPILNDDGLLRDIKASLADHGLRVSDGEMIRMNEDTNLERFRPFLERLQALGARHVLVAGDDPDRARLTDTYGKLCALLWEHGLTADLEFMPWTPVRGLADARALVEAVTHPGAAILFDCLHFHRSGGTLAELAAVPAGMMNYVQVCDGPVPFDPDGVAMMMLGRTGRLIPGEGGIDLKGIVANLPRGIAVSVEVPNVALRDSIGVEALVARALATSRALFD